MCGTKDIVINKTDMTYPCETKSSMGSHHLFLNYYSKWCSVTLPYIYIISRYWNYFLNYWSIILIASQDRELWEPTTELLSIKEIPHFLGWHSKTIYKLAPSSLLSKYILLHTCISIIPNCLLCPNSFPELS